MKTPSFFDVDPPRAHDCARDGHVWTKGVHVWPGEDFERLVWRCVHCSALRGRM